MNIGKSIKVALAQHDKDRKWLAGELDISQAHMSNLVNNKTRSANYLDKLAEAFNMPVSEFIALGE